MILPARARLAAVAVLGASLLSAAGPSAWAEGRLASHYTISMAGVPIGRIVWIVDIAETRYTATASGKAGGVLSVLVSGEGTVTAQGAIADRQLKPATFVSAITDEDGDGELRMRFENGAVRDLVAPVLPQKRVPVTEAHRSGVSDPLSAVLIPETDGDPLASANCNRVLAVFDGRRRYDLAMTFKRVDKVKLKQGYTGLVLVCGVVLHPIAGHRADSVVVKYVAGRRDMEAWFAPIAGAGVIAPVRVMIPTLLGTLEVAADQFEAERAPPR
ncbi:MAG: DUF3108 domain-containing protein [Pseudolabrys sp.]|nr:DUF3108 domain-containing protein [Pseudolabrys sp.]